MGMISHEEQSATWVIRMLCLGGVLVTSYLLLLGFGWPSYIFTPIAIMGLPSPILFLIAAFFPSLIRKYRVVRYYLIGCCIASALSWLFEFWWLHHVDAM